MKNQKDMELAAYQPPIIAITYISIIGIMCDSSLFSEGNNATIYTPDIEFEEGI